MDTNELMQHVADERLDTPILDGVGSLHEDAVVMTHDAGVWTVYLVDERDAIVRSTLKTFDSKSDALEHVLTKLRQVAAARAALARMRARRSDRTAD